MKLYTLLDYDIQHILQLEEVRACGKFMFATFILISENGGTSTDMAVENKYIFSIPSAAIGLDELDWQTFRIFWPNDTASTGLSKATVQNPLPSDEEKKCEGKSFKTRMLNYAKHQSGLNALRSSRKEEQIRTRHTKIDPRRRPNKNSKPFFMNPVHHFLRAFPRLLIPG